MVITRWRQPLAVRQQSRVLLLLRLLLDSPPSVSLFLPFKPLLCPSSAGAGVHLSAGRARVAGTCGMIVYRAERSASEVCLCDGRRNTQGRHRLPGYALNYPPSQVPSTRASDIHVRLLSAHLLPAALSLLHLLRGRMVARGERG